MEIATDKKVKRVFLVDDHPVVRYGIGRILNNEADIQVCGEAGDGNEALAGINELSPDIVILDISLKEIDGLKLAKHIRSKHPQIPILVLSMHNEMIYAHKALRAGANGYIMKERSSEELVAAVRQVLSGTVYVSEAVKNKVLNAFVAYEEDPAGSSVVERLSDRERQIFLLLGKGLTSRMIAKKLGLSIKTVDTHRSRIKLKLGIETTPQLLLAAAEWADHEGLSAPLTD